MNDQDPDGRPAPYRRDLDHDGGPCPECDGTGKQQEPVREPWAMADGGPCPHCDGSGVA